MPFDVKFWIVQFSTCTWPAANTRTPFEPFPLPSSDRFLRITMSVAAAFTMMSLAVGDASTPASAPAPSIVIDLVIVTLPYPPPSTTSMYPPAAVLLMAPANVLHGAVRLHGF